jgi:hypothetical protein
MEVKVFGDERGEPGIGAVFGESFGDLTMQFN